MPLYVCDFALIGSCPSPPLSLSLLSRPLSTIAGPTLAALFNAVPASSRGTAQGLFSVLAALGNLAPVVVGAFAGGALGNYQLGDVLLVSVCACYVGCSALFVLAALEDDQKIALREVEAAGGENVIKGL